MRAKVRVRHEPSTRRRRLPTVAAAVVLAVVLGACQPALVTNHGAHSIVILTYNGSDNYTYASGDQGAVTVSAPKTNKLSNLRVAGFDPQEVPSVDQETCVTWTDELVGIAQPGVVLRLRTDATRVRAIMVTNNVIYNYRKLFNVHLLDTAADEALVIGGSVEADWTDAPLPWRICARVEGVAVTLKAWPAADPEPTWDDPAHAGTVQVPQAWVFPGTTGWYAGHLAAGQHLSYQL